MEMTGILGSIRADVRDRRCNASCFRTTNAYRTLMSLAPAATCAARCAPVRDHPPGDSSCRITSLCGEQWLKSNAQTWRKKGREAKAEATWSGSSV